ncbi:inositol monophosphatase family protein [Streptomyces aidingensis]|uniref:inositol-phosphate phosphatase n=1 Tax=Streptomyces aidingensis TaxID=910347 RepID=A0A1I1FSI6_9ACTN|nr:inositol monophosphatase family protein [Streptomyces aidingensis]SFC01992.1 myo-inositol-1(or 4)-monophosphatase [Streptomyces aidingensis]
MSGGRAGGGEDPAVLLAVAERCCREAARRLRAGAGGATRAHTKPGRRFDQVTAADTAIEDYLATALTAAVPGSAVLGEERGGRAGTGGITWYVDPVDGTGNFVRGLPLVCVSVGAAVHGRVVAGCVVDVFRDECFTGGEGLPLRVGPAAVPGPPGGAAAAGVPLVLTDVPLPGRVDRASVGFLAELLERAEVRRLYCTALSLAWVAAGRADAACNLGIHPWDTAAGAALVRAAGGRWTPVGGDPAGPPEHAPGFVAAGPGPEAKALGDWLTERLTALARPG